MFMISRNNIIFVLALTFSTLLSTVDAQSHTQRNKENLDSVKKSNTRIWLEAQKNAIEEETKDSELASLNYNQTMADLEKQKKEARLKRIEGEIEAYERLVSQEVRNNTPTFDIDGHAKERKDTCHGHSIPIIESEGNKSDSYISAYAKISPIPFEYAKTTFSSQSEILDFIKTLDFDKNPPAKRLCDFFNDEKKITEDKVLIKGIELYQKGNAKKAADYFTKLYKNEKKYSKEQREYAAWQVTHYMLFGIMDIYFNGTPSLIDRENIILNNGYKCDTYLSFGYPYVFLVADPNMRTYDPRSLLKVIATKTEIVNKQLCSNPRFTQEFLAAALYEAFPKDREININSLIENDWIFDNKPFKYEVTGESSEVSRCNDFIKSISDFFNIMDCMHLIARTKSQLNDKYGIGLTANELYRKALLLNPNKGMNLTDYNEGFNNISDNDEQCQILLLRSLYFGNPDAAIALLPYIVETVQQGYGMYFLIADRWIKMNKEDPKGFNLQANADILYSIQNIIKGISEMPRLKDVSYIWETLNTTIKDIHRSLRKQLVDNIYEKEAENRAKKERRKQFWNNMANALLSGLANGVNAYMASQYQVRTPVNAASIMHGDNSGSLADAMSQPGYFQNVHQQLLQQSMNQVQWAEMQEYNQTREAYQRMGRDLSLNEFRVLKGQAIANLKEQGYDIIAEQKAINDDMNNFNRSQMNSGKENVERIRQQNAQKHGTSSKSNTSTELTNSSSSSTNSNTSSRIPSSKTSTASSNRASSSKIEIIDYNAHEQYNNGNLNTQTSSYGDKIKNVNFAVKDGSTYRNVNLHGELYKKDGQYYVKIGGTFFKAENTGGSYNSYIIYGAKAYYFNK